MTVKGSSLRRISLLRSLIIKICTTADLKITRSVLIHNLSFYSNSRDYSKPLNFLGYLPVFFLDYWLQN